MNNNFSKYYGYIDLLNYLIDKDKIEIKELEHIMRHLQVLIKKHEDGLEV